MVRATLGTMRSPADAGVMPLREREDGQAIVEYALLIGGVALFLIAAFVVTGLDEPIQSVVDAIRTAFS